jgi:predicted CXXCH cytochrome family protein
MANSRTTAGWVLALGAAGLLASLSTSCHETAHGHVHEHEARAVGAATIVLEVPETLGEPDRPLVEFDHDVHTNALGGESCLECHATVDLDPALGTAQGTGVSTEIEAAGSVQDIDELMEAAHGLCIGCHEEGLESGRETGPIACGECHVRRSGEAEPEREPMRFDYSLHQRHSEAEGDRCETCHHVYDQASKRLVHRAGAEESCADCHGEHEAERGRSLDAVSHRTCINCHRDRRSRGRESGPETCTGCHDARSQAQIERLDDMPRLKRAQPDLRWIRTEGATSHLVAYDHKLHESPRVSRSCSSCHHHALKACGDCHTLNGGELGAGVTLEQAFHAPGSARSCVGCHQRRIERDGECMSCHHALGQPPTEVSCRVCHNGPTPELAAEMAAETALALSPRPLPEPSRDFPSEVVIDVLADQFGPSKLPHREIVEAMDRAVRPSALAVRSHGGHPVPCSGCHHNSPGGTRPPPCRACHADTAHPTADVPALETAYHRQCIGCHQRMGIDATGCTDCHEHAPRGVER